MRCGKEQEEEDSRELDEDEDAVEPCTFLCAMNEEEGEQERDEYGGQIEDATVRRYVRECVREVDPR